LGGTRIFGSGTDSAEGRVTVVRYVSKVPFDGPIKRVFETKFRY